MVSDILPLFKSHYSIGRSILTLEKNDSPTENGPDSIVDLALENDFKQVTVVDDSMSGFLEAYMNLKEAKIDFRFGLRLGVANDYEDKTEASLQKTSKVVIFVKNTKGYEKLIKIYSFAAKDGFYYKPRIDYKTLEKLWSEPHLKLCIPFYDSFIFNNSLGYGCCVPEISFTEPTFFVESNGLPFDSLVRGRVIEYAKEKHEVQEVKSIYYNLKEDFINYLTFRCINNRSTLNKPRLDHMSSDLFSLESWKERKIILEQQQ